MAIAVVGMHRSGTSLVARLLNLAGVDLGPKDHLMAPAKDNEDGFWEDLRFVKLNERILNAVGGDWDVLPPAGAAGASQALEPMRAAAEKLIASARSNDDWGWKDPRTSLLLPFWLSVLPELRVVVCIRNPLEVALSLHHRNHLSYTYGISLWQAYYERILESAPEDRRLVTHHDAYFTAPAEPARLLAFCGLSEPRSATFRTAVDPDHRHYRLTLRHLWEAGLSKEVIDLYVQLCELAAHAEPPDEHPEPVDLNLDEYLDSVRTNEPTAIRPSSSPTTSVDSLLSRISQLRTDVETATAHVEGQLAAFGDQVAVLSQQELARSSSLADLNHNVTALVRREAKTTQALDTLVRQLHDRAEREGARMARLESGVDELERALDERMQPLATEEGEYPRLVQRVSALVREVTPRGSTIAVVSKGDDALVQFRGRTGWHFPRSREGRYSGYHPADSTAAVANLEAARSAGADFLLLPAPSAWWLDHYAAFRQHLDRRYPLLVDEPGTCAVFALRQPVTTGKAVWLASLDDLIADFEGRFDRDPIILDCHTGLDLAAEYPDLMVFAPPSPAEHLPYLDDTVDIVAVRADDDLAREATRVAWGAVASFVQSPKGLTVEPDWRESSTARLPSLSIVIPTYNGVVYSEPFVLSLLENIPSHADVEILVVDDCSEDDTQARLGMISHREPRLRLFRNKVNSGFIRTCNRGAKAARNEIIVFLNDDMVAMPNWIPSLLRTFRHHPDAGAVTGKLLFPDGRLQEAGGVVFSDARAANFGKWDTKVEDPLYNYVREVDYGSGCLLATPRDLFLDLGGFDERYRPMYYEDSDYCFKIRQRGLKVYYQPECVLIHVEGGTAGTDESQGHKRYQAGNRAKFLARWRQELLGYAPYPPDFDIATLHGLAVRGASRP